MMRKRTPTWHKLSVVCDQMEICSGLSGLVRLTRDICAILTQMQTNVGSGHVVRMESRALASVSALLRKRATASVLFSSSCALISTSCRAQAAGGQVL